MSRKFFVGGNWKLNPTSLSAAKSLVESLKQASLDPNTEVVLAPPSIYLIPIQEAVAGSSVGVAAQNCYIKENGAFTGEISASQLVDAKIGYVILGHSERRTIFKESSEVIAHKTQIAVHAGLTVIFCIGETLEEREKGDTEKVVDAQIDALIDVLDEAQWSKIVVAYEPVWAIGTGKVATPEQAQDVHKHIRGYLASKVSASVSEETRIIYGGSVAASNCSDLTKRDDIDGFLVGGASLKPEFATIVNSRRL